MSATLPPIELTYIDTMLFPTLENLATHCSALSKAVSEYKLSNADLRDSIGDAAIAAHQAKQIYDREFKGREVADEKRPGHTKLVIETEQQKKAVRLIHRHLNQCYNNLVEVRDTLYNRAHVQSGEKMPPELTFEEWTMVVEESLHHDDATREAGAPEHAAHWEALEQTPAMKVKNQMNMGLFADALGGLRGAVMQLDEREKAAANSKA